MDTINTIFYFPESLTFEDYSNKLNRGEISGRTIVLANEQKAIYKNGKKYGGLDEQELRAFIDSLSGNSWISDEIDGAKGDITRISELEAQLRDLINQTKSRLDDEIENKDSDIQQKVEELMIDAQWIQENFPQGVTEWDDDWNSELEAYLRTVGYWTTDTNGNTITQWSKLQQSVDTIKSQVNNLTQNGSLTTALTTTIEQKIQDDIAALSLNTTYANKDAEKLLAWMYSGLDLNSSADTTFAQLQSMSKNNFKSAISSIKTYVNKLKSGDYVATADISTYVGDVISGMISQASDNNALSALYAKSESNKNHIAQIMVGITGNSSTASISTAIGNALSNYTSTTTFNTVKQNIESAIKDSNGNYISSASLKQRVSDVESQIAIITGTGSNSAGFITKSNLKSAISEMFATDTGGDVTASVITSINDGKSEVKISADAVTIDAYLQAGKASFNGNVQASSFQTGTKKQNGIVVLSEDFDESTANKKKAYFAYDSTQGGITMYFYKTDGDSGAWKRIDLGATAVSENEQDFRQDTYYYIGDKLSYTVIPTDLQATTIYTYRSRDLAYDQPSTASNYITGYYISGKSYNKMLTTLQDIISGNYTPTLGQNGTQTDGLWDSGYLASNACWGSSIIREIHSDGTRVKSGMLYLTPSALTDILTVAYFNNGVLQDTYGVRITIGIRDLYLDANGNIKKAVLAPVVCVESNTVNTTSQNTAAVFKRANSKKSSICIAYDGIIAQRNTQNSLFSNYYVYCHYTSTTILKALTYTIPDDYTRSNSSITRAFDHTGTATVINPTSTAYPYPYSSSLSSYSGTQFYT